MAHIGVNDKLPGINALLTFRSQTARPLNELGNVLLRGESSLTAGERELIAGYVSHVNACTFCTGCHTEAAVCLLDGDRELVDAVLADPAAAPLSRKMRALLRIAAAVARDPKTVDPADINAARAAGADDIAIHDAVLIAAAFCMYNRYVDGLATWQPDDAEMYRFIGERLATKGYTSGEDHIVRPERGGNAEGRGGG